MSTTTEIPPCLCEIPARLLDPQQPITADERRHYGISYIGHQGRRLTNAQVLMLGLENTNEIARLKQELAESRKREARAVVALRIIADPLNWAAPCEWFGGTLIPDAQAFAKETLDALRR